MTNFFAIWRPKSVGGSTEARTRERTDKQWIAPTAKLDLVDRTLGPVALLMLQ